jgi:hypothetical protein
MKTESSMMTVVVVKDKEEMITKVIERKEAIEKTEIASALSRSMTKVNRIRRHSRNSSHILILLEKVTVPGS